MHVNSIFDQLSQPYSQLIIQAWWQFDIRIEQLLVIVKYRQVSTLSSATLVLIRTTLFLTFNTHPWLESDPLCRCIPTIALPLILVLLILVLRVPPRIHRATREPIVARSIIAAPTSTVISGVAAGAATTLVIAASSTV